jgi:hypothetical protein
MSSARDSSAVAGTLLIGTNEATRSEKGGKFHAKDDGPLFASILDACQSGSENRKEFGAVQGEVEMGK